MRNFDRYGCVETNENGLVSGYTEKRFYSSGNINGGIYLCKTNIFDNYILEDKFSFEEFIQSNFQELKIGSVLFDNYFIDIGIPEDYKKAQDEIINLGLD